MHKIIFYLTGAILLGDSITIEIRDSNVIPYQTVVFEAGTKRPESATEKKSSMSAFYHPPATSYVSPYSSPRDLKDDRIDKSPQKFTLDGVNYGFVTLNEIQLIDWDKQMFEDDTENKIVEDVLFASN